MVLRRLVFALLPVMLALLSGCARRPPEPAVAGPGSDLARLGEYLSGSFSSQAQSQADESYFDIRLQMIPIWPERRDGPWLYVEQALAARIDRPYRQRVYQLGQLAPDLFESRVYTLPDPAAAIGAWREERPLAELAPADLTERTGCSIVLRRQGEAFAGSTIGTACASDLAGAAHATSRVTATADLLESWDQGFDEQGEQVWGPEAGPYRFVKLAANPAE